MKAFISAISKLLDSDSEESAKDPVADAVARSLPDADEDTLVVVTAIAGLLACVAFADGIYHPKEAERVREELGRIDGLSAIDADVIARVLDTQIGSVTAAGHQKWVRDLRQRTTREQRFEVLEVLVGLAAADDDLATVEANYLRRLTSALGLGQDEYNAAQQAYRDRLSVLREGSR